MPYQSAYQLVCSYSRFSSVLNLCSISDLIFAAKGIFKSLYRPDFFHIILLSDFFLNPI